MPTIPQKYMKRKKCQICEHILIQIYKGYKVMTENVWDNPYSSKFKNYIEHYGFICNICNILYKDKDIYQIIKK